MFDAVTFETEGQVSFIVNLMFFAEVKLTNIRKNGDFCRFTVKSKHAEKAEKTLKNHGKEYKIVKDKSVKSFVKSNVTRFGLYVGIALSAIIFYAFSTTVTEIKISGASLVNEQSVKEATMEVCPLPVRKTDVNTEELEKKLIALDGVSNTSLRVKGNVLYVEILEELEKPEVVDYNDKTPKKSKYDAIVEKVTVYSGTPEVRVGDVVKKGDVLISPVKTFGDGETSEVCALGDVLGRIWLSERYVFPPTIITSERTGKKKSYFVGKSSDILPKSPYKEYETETTEETSVMNLPKMKKITYYETHKIEREFDYFKEKERIIEEKIAALGEQIPDGAEKIATRYTEKMLDKNVVLDIYYEILVLITE